MFKKGSHVLFLTVWVYLIQGLTSVDAQTGTQVEFGQNRVQYRDFDWQHHESDYFTTYFYPGGQELAKFTVIAAEEKVKDLEKKLNFILGEKVEILIYNHISDLSQTNIGISEDLYNVGGTSTAQGTKIFLYFDGNHSNMLNMLQKELALIFIHKMMAGKNLMDLVKNAVLLNLPEWYIDGLAAFLGEGWSTHKDDQLRKYWNEEKKPSFIKLTQKNQEYAGQALWNYIQQQYGEAAVINIIYLTRIHRSVKKGFAFALGSSLEDIIKDWEEHCIEVTKSDMANRNAPNLEDRVRVKVRKKQHLSQLLLSPDGKHIAYSVSKAGRYKVFSQNTESGKRKKIMKGGFNSENYPYDYSYPILAWNPSGSVLTTIYEKKENVKQIDFDLVEKRKTRNDIRGFQRVYQASYTPDGRSLVLSAQNRGQTDIYTYHLTNRTPTQITQDIFDDSEPNLVDIAGTRGILFSSNRPNDTVGSVSLDSLLPIGNPNLFFYDLQSPNQKISQLSDDNFASFTKSQKLSEHEFTFLSDRNGIQNLYKATIGKKLTAIDTIHSHDSFELDSIYTYKSIIEPLTNFDTHVTLASTAPRANKWTYAIQQNNRFEVYVSTIPTQLGVTDIAATAYRKALINSKAHQASDRENFSSTEEVEIDSLLLQDFSFHFNTTYDYTLLSHEERRQIAQGQLDSIRLISEEEYQNIVNQKEQTTSKFRPGLSVPYRAKFSTNYITTQIDNSVLPFAYESVAQNGSSYEYPNLSGMLMYGIQDLMEDHKLLGGFRFPIDLKGSEIFVSYENLKKRLDKRFLFYRKSGQDNLSLLVNNTFTIPAIGKKKTHYAEVRLSYPFDVTKSLRLYSGFRNDRLLFAYTDTITMIADIDRNENWSFFKLEFVHDNSRELQMNIYNGFRYKFYAEYFKNWNKKKTNLFTFGYDIRHYTTIFKNIIWANRVAGASSFGQKKIRYYIGGTDTWINNKYDYNTATPNPEDYAFQSHSTNVRGFPINIRNGSSHMVFNSEIRLPLFSFLMKRSIRSSFIENFQIAGFFDVGSAYNGLTPFNQDNPYITEQVTPSGTQTPIVVEAKYYRNPTVMGTGVGVRTMLLGYFMRLDWAWGIDGGLISNKPMWLFSFSKDF